MEEEGSGDVPQEHNNDHCIDFIIFVCTLQKNDAVVFSQWLLIKVFSSFRKTWKDLKNFRQNCYFENRCPGNETFYRQ